MNAVAQKHFRVAAEKLMDRLSRLVTPRLGPNMLRYAYWGMSKQLKAYRLAQISYSERKAYERR